MYAEELLTYCRAIPFRPFRLVMNSGKTYDIRHPEMARVTLSAVYVFFADSPDRPAQRVEAVSLSLIQNVEHIDSPAAAGGSP